MTDRPILVVEDDAGLQDVLQGIIEMRGFVAAAAFNGAEALALLDQVQPRLILLDLNMPVMNGWEFLAAFRQRADCPGIPVVVLSAFGSYLAARGAGANDYLSKPFEIHALLGLIDRYCGPAAETHRKI